MKGLRIGLDLITMRRLRMVLVELAFFTDRVEEMSAFYRALLGNDPVAASEDMAIFMSGSTKIFVHRSYVPQNGELPPENHTAFSVANVDAACAVLQQAGMVIEVPPQDYYWGRSAYLRDPDQHLVELIQTDELK
jgi:catechol 2,3-dioxygenase-like lactoylglutathione lyase family enzyme